MQISIADVQFSSLSLTDEGRVFRWNGKLYRGIKAEHSKAVYQLFTSGLIDALVKEGVFVPSWIADCTIDEFELVIEHQIVDVVSYPHEWSFSMLKDAALLVLKVNEISNEFGYQTKDCHGYNVLFIGEKPVYIDLGSFIPFHAKNIRTLAGRSISSKLLLSDEDLGFSWWRMGQEGGPKSSGIAGHRRLFEMSMAHLQMGYCCFCREVDV